MFFCFAHRWKKEKKKKDKQTNKQTRFIQNKVFSYRLNKIYIVTYYQYQC